MTNCTSPRCEQRRCASASVCDLAHEVEVAAVLQRVQQRAAYGPWSASEHRGGQMLRVGIDREAEEHELHQRDADHHREGQPVAPHLDELLHDDRPEHGAKRECRSAASHATKLSFDCVHEDG